MCCLHDRPITDRKKQQIGERRVTPAPYGVQQVRADVHFDPCPLLQHDILLEGYLAKRQGRRVAPAAFAVVVERVVSLPQGGHQTR